MFILYKSLFRRNNPYILKSLNEFQKSQGYSENQETLLTSLDADRYKNVYKIPLYIGVRGQKIRMKENLTENKHYMLTEKKIRKRSYIH